MYTGFSQSSSVFPKKEISEDQSGPGCPKKAKKPDLETLIVSEFQCV